MAYIRQIEHADATGDLKAFYDALFEIVGSIPNIVKLSSLKLRAASAAQDLYQSVLYHDSGLSMEEKEMVATVVVATVVVTTVIPEKGYLWKYTLKIQCSIDNYARTVLKVSGLLFH